MFPDEIEVGTAERRTTFRLRGDLTRGDVPVYEVDGVEARPNGSVWIRFAEGIDAASRAADIVAAGYRIERVPGYAPNAAFVTAGSVADALTRLGALRAIAGVEVVEPQMLMERKTR